MSEKLKEKEVNEIKEDVEIKDVTNEPKKRGRKKIVATKEDKENTEKEMGSILKC